MRGACALWLGVEQDYYGVCGIKYDYRLGAVHYLTGDDGTLYGIDHSLDTFSELFAHFGGDIRSLARAYYGKVYEMAVKNRPDVIVHYDLICKFNENNRFFDEEDPVYRRIALETLEAIYPLCDMLEVNTWRDGAAVANAALSHAGAAGALARAGRPRDHRQRLPRRGEARLGLRRGARAH